MAVIKANVQEQFFVLKNDTARNKNLSLDAKGLILVMASRPPQWEFNKSQLMDECGIGRDRLNRIFRELVEHGYLYVEQTKGNQGKFENANYHFYTDPSNNPCGKPLTGNPSTDNPCNGKSAPIKERANNKQKQIKQINKYKDLDFWPLNFTDNQVEEFIRIRIANNGSKKITQRVVNALAKEFNDALGKGYTVDELLTEWEVRGWKSFKSEWVKPKQNQNGQFSDVTQRNIQNFAQVELK